MVKIIIGLAVAATFFFIAYKIIKPAKLQEEKKNMYICDVCNNEVCECRKVDED